MGIQGQKMNERIQKLADEAGLYVDLYGKPWPKSMSAEECEAAYKKFAQLIVQECVDAVGDGPMQRPEIQRIKARFGVEYYEPIEKAFGS